MDQLSTSILCDFVCGSLERFLDFAKFCGVEIENLQELDDESFHINSEVIISVDGMEYESSASGAIPIMAMFFYVFIDEKTRQFMPDLAFELKDKEDK